MNKNIEAKLREFEKKRVKNLRQIHKEPKNSQLRVESIELRQEMFDWLKEISYYEYSDDVSKLQIDSIVEAIWNRVLIIAEMKKKLKI